MVRLSATHAAAVAGLSTASTIFVMGRMNAFTETLRRHAGYVIAMVRKKTVIELLDRSIPMESINPTTANEPQPKLIHEPKTNTPISAPKPWWHTLLPGGLINGMLLWAGLVALTFVLIGKANTGINKLADLSADMNHRQTQLEVTQTEQASLVKAHGDTLNQHHTEIEVVRTTAVKGIGQVKADQAKDRSDLRALNRRVEAISEQIRGLQGPVIQGSINAPVKPQPVKPGEAIISENTNLQPCPGATPDPQDKHFWTVPKIDRTNHRVEYARVMSIKAGPEGTVIVFETKDNAQHTVNQSCEWDKR